MYIFTPPAHKSNLTTVMELDSLVMVSRWGLKLSRPAFKSVQKYPDCFVNRYEIKQIEAFLDELPILYLKSIKNLSRSIHLQIQHGHF